MLNQIKYVSSWVNVKLNHKLGQHGAEMVEYAIVLACICAVGVMFYGSQTKGEYNLNHILDVLWSKVLTTINTKAQ